MAKFGPKKSKLSSLAENWHTECLDDVDFCSDITFLSFQPWMIFWTNFWKIQSCSFWLKIGTHGISRMLILIPTIFFWIANPNSFLRQIWSEKVKAVCFAWKLAHMHIHTQDLEDVDSYFDISFLKFRTKNLRMLILILRLDANLNSFFGQIWVKKLNSPLCLEAGTRVSWRSDCKNTGEGLEEKIKMNDCIKCLLLLHL